MVKIRLTRTGRTHQPSYRLVAVPARSKRDGKVLEYLGHYNPRTKPSTFEYKKDRVEYWLSVGAQPTETVRDFLAKDKLVVATKKDYKKKPGRKATERAEAKASQEADKKADEAK